MNDMTQEYWNLHREVYNSFFDECDEEIRRAIMENPEGFEAEQLNQKVNQKVRDQLGMEF